MVIDGDCSLVRTTEQGSPPYMQVDWVCVYACTLIKFICLVFFT